MKTIELKTDYWKDSQKKGRPIYHYDEVMDTLFLYFSPSEKERIISHFVDEHVAFLFRHSDNQIVGMKIEYFKDIFLPKTVELKTWRLSSTGEKLNGIRDIKVNVEIAETIKPATRQFTVPRPIENNIQLEPVFA